MKKRGPLLSIKTKLQGHLMLLIFTAMVVPVVVFGSGLLALVEFSSMSMADVAADELRTRILLYVLVVFPLTATPLLVWAFVVTNRLVGPIERMERELDARLTGTAGGPIVLRPKDTLLPMSEKMNAIIADWEKLKKERA